MQIFQALTCLGPEDINHFAISFACSEWAHEDGDPRKFKLSHTLREQEYEELDGARIPLLDNLRAIVVKANDEDVDGARLAHYALRKEFKRMLEEC